VYCSVYCPLAGRDETACNYGTHVDDQWSIGELLELAARAD
jgi:hypothetical protein